MRSEIEISRCTNFMYAVIETGGKQYRVLEGDVIFIEKLEVEAESTIVFDKVIAIGSDDDFKVGAPYITDAKVTAKVIKNGKGKKITIFKYKAKKNYRNKKGHRQPYTNVQIEKIEA